MADWGGGGNVQVLVQVRAAGLDQARAARDGLKELETGAGATSTRFDQLGTAFQRFEAREPSMVVRRTALALEGLGASAVGAQGQLGRLGATFALFAGPEAAAGLAAAGLATAAYRVWTQDARDLAGQHTKLAASLHEVALKAGGLAAQARQSLSGTGETPGFFRILLGEFGIGSGGAHVGEGLTERLQTQQQAVRDFTALLTRQFGSAP